jgi:hypothetical protein
MNINMKQKKAFDLIVDGPTLSEILWPRWIGFHVSAMHHRFTVRFKN